MSLEAARILVVEDNRDTSALLRDLLEAEGYGVESAMTGEKALEMLGQNPDVDLMVLDLMLPGMSGYDVIERLRAHSELAGVPVLVLSALSSTSARIRGLRDGADDYMTKPFLPEELLARTRTLVTSRLLERRTRELQALSQIAQASLTAANADVLLQRIVEITGDVFGAELAVLFLGDEARHALRARAAVGTDTPLDKLVMSATEGVGHQAITTGEPVLIEDGAADDRRVTDPAVRALGIRSLMVAPLIVGGTAVGVLEVGRKGRRLDPRADRLLRIVADRVAVALEHARLESEARELADVVRRIGEGVVVADAEARVTFANAAFADMVGVRAEDLRGRRWTEFLASTQDTAALVERMRQPAFEG
jgi:DNA-binding response OmpR family regulator